MLSQFHSITNQGHHCLPQCIVTNGSLMNFEGYKSLARLLVHRCGICHLFSLPCLSREGTKVVELQIIQASGFLLEPHMKRTAVLVLDQTGVVECLGTHGGGRDRPTFRKGLSHSPLLQH